MNCAQMRYSLTLYDDGDGKLLAEIPVSKSLAETIASHRAERLSVYDLEIEPNLYLECTAEQGP